jgi:hypothetical protein
MAPIDCTIREVGKTIARLDGATIEQVHAASGATQPFSDEDAARIHEIAASGRRVHLMLCGGSRYLAGISVFIVCDSAREARERGWKSITSV